VPADTVLAIHGYDLKVFFTVVGKTPRSQAAPDSPGEVRLGTVADVQDTVFGHERVILLPVIGHSRGKRRDMPVQVSVALLAAQAQAVHPLDRHDRGHRPGNPVHDALQRQILLLAQPADPVFDVALGGDDAVAQQRRLPGQERDRARVLIDIVMGIARMPGQDRAHEARALARPLYVSHRVKRHARRLRDIHPGIIAPSDEVAS
jgi:hypothetical protein